MNIKLQPKCKDLQIIEQNWQGKKKEYWESLEQTNNACSFMQNHMNHFPLQRNIVMEKVKQQQIAHEKKTAMESKISDILNCSFFCFVQQNFSIKKRNKKFLPLRKPCGNFIAKNLLFCKLLCEAFFYVVIVFLFGFIIRIVISFNDIVETSDMENINFITTMPSAIFAYF